MSSQMKIKKGDLVSQVSKGIILQQVNAQGVMGSGFAKSLFEKYPIVREQYLKEYKSNQPDQGASYLGTVQLVELTSELFVLNMVGQQFFGRTGERFTCYEALDRCLVQAREIKDELELEVHHPLIGAGLGGGSWDVVKSLITTRLGETTCWVL